MEAVLEHIAPALALVGVVKTSQHEVIRICYNIPVLLMRGKLR